MFLFFAFIVFVILVTMVRFGFFGFYAAAVPMFSILGMYEFASGKQAERDVGASADPMTIGMLGLSGTDWLLIAAVAWIGLAICIFLIKSGISRRHGEFSQRLLCGPWL